MSDLIFYTHPQSRGQTIRWMLEEVGAPYDVEVLDYATTMKAEPYLSVNPMGKVPAIRHKGKVVTEVAAICCYLADAFPEPDWLRQSTTAPLIIVGSSSRRARSRQPSATRLRDGSRRRKGNACSATEITIWPSTRWRRR